MNSTDVIIIFLLFLFIVVITILSYIKIDQRLDNIEDKIEEIQNMVPNPMFDLSLKDLTEMRRLALKYVDLKRKGLINDESE